MPYWVALLETPPTSGVMHAQVEGPESLAQFNARFGAGAANNGVNPGAGFPTRLAAQQAANKFNGQSTKQREVPGSRPFTPSDLLNPSGGIPGAKGLDLLHGFNFGNWVLRIGEIILGAVLIGVGIAKMTGVDNVISSALKVVK